jgi:hypothetical protein
VRHLSAVVLLLAFGCSSGSYRVEVAFAAPADRDRAQGISLALLAGGCGAQTPGGAPIAAVQEIVVRRGATATLAPVPPGRYGLYGVARDASCAVVASGCNELALIQGASGVARVLLRSVDGPACDGARCIDGVCEDGRLDGGALDGGVRDASADLDAQANDAETSTIDASLDAPSRDGGPLDAPSSAPIDAGRDAPIDAGRDAPIDGGRDAGVDSGPPTTRCGTLGTTIFCDGFEFVHPSALGPWTRTVITSGSTLATTTSPTFLGSRSLQSRTVTGSVSAALMRDLGASIGGGDVWIRGYFYMPASSGFDWATLIYLFGGEPGDGIAVMVRGDDSLGIYLGPSDISALHGSRGVRRDAWNCVELHISIADSGGLVEMFLEGLSAGSFGPHDTLPPGGFEELYVGVENSSATHPPFTLYTDEVVVARTRMPCE